MGTLPGQLKGEALVHLWVRFRLHDSLEGPRVLSWWKDGGPASEHSQGPIA